MTEINHKTNRMKLDSSKTEEVDCCKEGVKILSRTVRTPEGLKLFHLCNRHKDLEYFIQYSTSEERL